MPERVAGVDTSDDTDVRHELLLDARDVLTRWPAPSPEQDALRRYYLAHLEEHSDGLWREGPREHLTASCIVLDETYHHALLCLHGKGGFWGQFGGHLEREDRTLVGAALRETREESGVEQLALLSDEPVDLDRHALSAAFGRCREHLDVTFAATADRAAPTVVSAESRDVAWWPLDALPDDVVSDLPGRLDALVSRLRG